MQITIVSAVPEDVRGITEVLYKTWLVTYPNKEVGVTVEDVEDWYKGSFTEEALAKRAERMREQGADKMFFLAKDGNDIIGMCHIILHGDKNQLKAIYILPEYQGKGVGRMLWDEVQKHLDFEKDTIVQVATYNTKAIGFYKRLGFEETGKEFADERFRMKSGAVIPEKELIIKGEAHIS